MGETKSKLTMKDKLFVFQKTMLLLVLMLVGATQARAQENYGLRIAGVEVTSENCNDLSVIDGVSGTVKYAPETKTLFLENATIAAGKDNVGIENLYRIDSLTINVTGENKITSNKDAMYLVTNVTLKEEEF